MPSLQLVQPPASTGAVNSWDCRACNYSKQILSNTPFFWEVQKKKYPADSGSGIYLFLVAGTPCQSALPPWHEFPVNMLLSPRLELSVNLFLHPTGTLGIVTFIKTKLLPLRLMHLYNKHLCNNQKMLLAF